MICARIDRNACAARDADDVSAVGGVDDEVVARADDSVCSVETGEGRVVVLAFSEAERIRAAVADDCNAFTRREVRRADCNS